MRMRYRACERANEHVFVCLCVSLLEVASVFDGTTHTICMLALNFDIDQCLSSSLCVATQYPNNHINAKSN